MTGQLSITNYYRLNNSRFVYTVETPTGLPWEDRLKIQQTALTMLLETYTGDESLAYSIYRLRYPGAYFV